MATMSIRKLIVVFLLYTVFSGRGVTASNGGNNRFIFEPGIANQFECKYQTTDEGLIFVAKNVISDIHSESSLVAPTYVKSFRISFAGPFSIDSMDYESVTFSVSFPEGLDSIYLKRDVGSENPALLSNMRLLKDLDIGYYVELMSFQKETFQVNEIDQDSLIVSSDGEQMRFFIPSNRVVTQFLFDRAPRGAYFMSFFEPSPSVCFVIKS